MHLLAVAIAVAAIFHALVDNAKMVIIQRHPKYPLLLIRLLLVPLVAGCLGLVVLHL